MSNMPKMTLVPVDHEPEFGGGYSLVPIDHNPFSADGMIDQARGQLASQPERFPTSYGNPAGDAAAMQPETFANPYVKGLIDSTASLPRRAIENSQHSIDTGTYDPGPTLEAAMLPMGTGALAGVPVRSGEAVLGAGPIRAYHGSPHDFDRFDLSKIGTGEGAQAYGHGLYFAENEGTAKSYRNTLSAPLNKPALRLSADGQTIADMPAFKELPLGVQRSVNSAMSLGANKEQAVKNVIYQKEQSIKDAAANAGNPNIGNLYRPEYHDQAAEFIKSLPDNLTHTGKAGRMYEVNINADPAHFLDWDKSLNQHAPQTQDAIKRAMSIDYYGKPDPSKAERIWSEFGGANTGTAVKQGFIASDDKLVANRLHDAGIPGIKYLDQGSRAAGDGSRNYVVFNDKLVDIVRKYAAAGVALPPAIAAEYEQMKASQAPPSKAKPYTAGLGL